MKNLLFLWLTASLFFACNSSSEPTATDADGQQYFGEKITADHAVPVEEVLAQMNTQDSVKTKFIGTVNSVCQMKGCWVTVQAKSGEELFVKFKDYAFFMPKDIAGQEVVMEGVAYREVTSVDELRHYAEDEGKSQEEIDAITEPEEELKFMASGVVVLPRKS